MIRKPYFSEDDLASFQPPVPCVLADQKYVSLLETSVKRMSEIPKTRWEDIRMELRIMGMEWDVDGTDSRSCPLL